jgi:hypothetical protein
VREPNELELKQTHVLAIALDEVSAKIRTGGPVDEEEDYARSVWAGVIPLLTQYGTPVPDDRVHPDAIPINAHRFEKDSIPQK